jgi:excisionase family DNA binding protein
VQAFFDKKDNASVIVITGAIFLPKPSILTYSSGIIDPLTTAEVARMLGVSQSRVRQFVLTKRLKAKKFGRDLVIEHREAERFKREGRLPQGRPVSKKRKPSRKR